MKTHMAGCKFFLLFILQGTQKTKDSYLLQNNAILVILVIVSIRRCARHAFGCHLYFSLLSNDLAFPQRFLIRLLIWILVLLGTTTLSYEPRHLLKLSVTLHKILIHCRQMIDSSTLPTCTYMWSFQAGESRNTLWR